MKLQIIAVCLFFISIYKVNSQSANVRCYSCGYELIGNGTKRPNGEIPFCDDFATAGNMVVDAGPVGIK